MDGPWMGPMAFMKLTEDAGFRAAGSHVVYGGWFGLFDNVKKHGTLSTIGKG